MLYGKEPNCWQRIQKIAFSLLYLLSYFLQTLYGLADLFIIGQYEGVAGTTAVSIGSQVMHMLTVMTAGLVMGATAGIGRAVGGGFPGKSRNWPFEGTLAVGEIFPPATVSFWCWMRRTTIMGRCSSCRRHCVFGFASGAAMPRHRSNMRS